MPKRSEQPQAGDAESSAAPARPCPPDAQLPTWLSPAEAEAVNALLPSPVGRHLVVRQPHPPQDGADVVAWTADGPVSVTSVHAVVDHLGCDGRVLQRALAMIPASRCQLGVSVRWSPSAPTTLVVRFAELQVYFEPIQATRRVQALATLASVALDPALTTPGLVEAVSLHLTPAGCSLLSVERVVAAPEVPQAAALAGAAIEVRYLLPTDGPLVAWRDDGGTMSRAVASEWWPAAPDPCDGRIGAELDETGVFVARWLRVTDTSSGSSSP